MVSSKISLVESIMNVLSSEANLLRLLNLARRNPQTMLMLEDMLYNVFIHLGWTDADTHSYCCRLFEDEVIELANWEASLVHCMPQPGLSNLKVAMAGRAEQVYAKFAEYLKPDVHVLDLGGGSGEIAELMMTDGRKVSVADVRDWRRSSAVRFVKVHGNSIGWLDRTADLLTAFHTWHHSYNPEELVKESFRVVKPGGRVIIIETVADTLEEYLYTCFIDWLYNRIFHYEARPEEKVPVPCQFRSAAGWEQLIMRLYGLTPTVSTNLGIYQDLAPLHHHLLVYDLP